MTAVDDRIKKTLLNVITEITKETKIKINSNSVDKDFNYINTIHYRLNEQISATKSITYYQANYQNHVFKIKELNAKFQKN